MRRQSTKPKSLLFTPEQVYINNAICIDDKQYNEIINSYIKSRNYSKTYK